MLKWVRKSRPEKPRKSGLFGHACRLDGERNAQISQKVLSPPLAKADFSRVRAWPSPLNAYFLLSGAVIVAGLVLTLGRATSWAGPPNPTDSDPFGNTAGGTDALLNVTPGPNGAGQSNTAFGFESLQSDTSGSLNTAVGFHALSANTTGGANTATGGSALVSNTTGKGNTAIGANALKRNDTGDYNTAISNAALSGNIEGSL
jgi:hypothetical protein